MITIELENNELVLQAGEQQLRVALPQSFREKAGHGTLALEVVGTSQTSAVLGVVKAGGVLVGGKFRGIAGDYKQCLAVISPPVTMTPGTSYKATAVLTNGKDSSGELNHTVTFAIEA